MPRIIIPTVDETGLDAEIAQHFGRTPYFTMVDFNEDKKISQVTTIPNKGEHFGGRSHAHDLLQSYHPDAVVVYGMGPRGLQSFQQAGIAVLKAHGNTTKDIVTAYFDNNLPELTTGCLQAHHK